MIPLSIAPDLMEAAVLLAEGRAERREARAFRRERDRIYEVTDPELREARFHSHHLRWFVRFGLQARVEESLRTGFITCRGRLQPAPGPPEGGPYVGDEIGTGDHGEFLERLAGGRILRAIARHEEGADLIDPAAPDPTPLRPLLVLRLRPESLVEAETLQALLRHELMHVADMLDPAFGYQRALPPLDDGPSAENILRDRYRVVWDVTIDGRLSRAGRTRAETRDARWQEFHAVFPMLGDGCPSAFERWWAEPHPTHAALAAFATLPAGANAGRAAGRCPVCRFPVASLDRRVRALSAPAAAAIRADHPSWRVEQGLCSQCVDLFEASGGRPREAAYQ